MTGTRSGAARAAQARRQAAQARRDAPLLSLEAQAAAVRVVAAGVDTLELHTVAPLRRALVDELEHLKALAQSCRKGERGPTWEAAGHAFEVSRSGGQRGSLLLLADALAVSVAPWAPQGLPTVTAEVRARHLWQDVDAAAQDAEEVLGVLTQGESPEVQVSRVDVTVDWQGWVPEASLLEAFVTRARRDAAYRQARAHSGWSWGGGGSIYARCYDKSLEVAGTEKAEWFPQVWGRSGAYDADAPVWRLEYQVRREAIRELSPFGLERALTSWDGTRHHLGSLWAHLSDGWLALRVPSSARRARWAVDPRWAALRFQGGFGLAQDLAAPVDLARVEAETEFKRTLDQLSGYLARGMAERWALRGPDDHLHQTFEALYGDVCRHLARKGQSLSEKVAELYEPLRLQAQATARRRTRDGYRAGAALLH